MKILFLGDYSNFHTILARELERRGHNVTVASDGSGSMNTRRDIDISRQPGILGSFRYLGDLFNLMPGLSGFDVVQIINPNFLSLKPGKIRYFFKEIKRNNGMMSLALAGTDSVFVDACARRYAFDYSEYRLGTLPAPLARLDKFVETSWLHPTLYEFCRWIYANVDCAVSGLYEYHKASAPLLGDKLAYIGLPVETAGVSSSRKPSGEKVNVLVGIKEEMTLTKGTDILLKAAREVERRHPDRVHVDEARNMPWTQYRPLQERADVVIDQLYSYTPAMNALQTMASGGITVSGGEEEYYNFIGEKELRPVFNINPVDDDPVMRLESLLTDTPLMQRLSAQGPEFVRKHNDVRTVADRLLHHWNKFLK